MLWAHECGFSFVNKEELTFHGLSKRPVIAFTGEETLLQHAKVAFITARGSIFLTPIAVDADYMTTSSHSSIFATKLLFANETAMNNITSSVRQSLKPERHDCHFSSCRLLVIIPLSLVNGCGEPLSNYVRLDD